jgi:site-specific recombinase XerC
LGWKEIKGFIDTAGEGLRAERERALLCVAYDTMARRRELVGFSVADVEILPNGSGRMLIRRSKTDQAGEGSVAYLSRTTVRWLQQWLEHAAITAGAIFRRLVGRGHIGDRLHEDSVSDVFKRVAAWIGMAAKQVRQVSPIFCPSLPWCHLKRYARASRCSADDKERIEGQDVTRL